MKLFLVLISLGFAITACDNNRDLRREKTFNSFDFSYDDIFSTCFSIKFTQGDTVFIRQHFASSFSGMSKSNTTYFAILEQSAKAELDSFTSEIKLSSFDTLYYRSYADGIDYQFYFEKDSITKLIRVHSDEAPRQLNALMNWIVKKKKMLQLEQIDTTINFESTKDFLPPKVEAPKMKFIKPKVK